MAAPHDPAVTVEAAFGNAPYDGVLTWVDLTTWRPRGLTVSRGRPSELDRFKAASCRFELTDTTARDLDPTNMSGTYAETVNVETFPAAGTPVTEIGTSLGTDNAQTLPGNVTAGDLLLAFVSVDANGTTATVTGTGSAVWTTLWDTLSSSNLVRSTCFARIATGSDALVVTGATQDYVCTIRRIVRHGCATTADIEVGTVATASSLNPDPPSLNAGAVKKWLWVCAATLDLTTGENLTVPPASFTTDVLTKSADSSSSVGQGVAWRQEEAQTVDPGAFTSTGGGGRWLANTFAVPPEVTTLTRSTIAPNVPVRVTAALAARATVFSDTCAGPGLDSRWRLTAGQITAALAGSVALGSGAQIDGPAFNFDADSSFQVGVVNGTTATQDSTVRAVLSNGGWLGWTLVGSTIAWNVNDGGTTVSGSATFNATNHRYLRFVISGEVVTFQRSANGSSWTTVATWTRGTDFSNTVDWSWAKLRATVTGAQFEADDFLVQASTFTRFRGVVDNWDYSPLPGNQGATVSVGASDAFKLLAGVDLGSGWAEAVAALEPAVWYPLDETAGTVAGDRSGHGWHAHIPDGVLELAAATSAPFLGDRGGVRFPAHGHRAGIRVPDGARITAVPYTWACWIQATAPLDRAAAFPENLAAKIVYTQNSLASDGWIFRVAVKAGSDLDETDPSNPVVASFVLSIYLTGTGFFHIADYTATVDDGLPHMVAVAVTSAAAVTVYVDGTPVPLLTSYVGYVGTLNGTYIGSDESVQGFPASYSWPGVVDEVVVFPAALTQAQIETLYVSALRPWDLDTTGARVGRVLDAVSWPAEFRRIDSGEVTMGPADVEGHSALTVLQQAEETEGGRLFVGLGGDIVFADAARADETPTGPPVFDDAGAGVDLIHPFNVRLDEQFLFTGASVARDGGSTQTYADAEAVARFGRRDWSGQVAARTDLEAYLRAVGTVERYKEPQPRIDAFTVAPQKDPSLWPTVLTADVGDAVTVAFQLLQTGDIYSETLDLASVDERVSDGAWTMTMTATPRDPAVGTFFEFTGTGDTGFDIGKWR